MIKILGIKYGGHDTSAALLINGKIVAAAAQERYTHDKHSRIFPIDAIKDCLKIGKISINDIDEIAYVNDINLLIREMYLRPALNNDHRLDFLIKDLEKIDKIYNFKEKIRKELKFKGKIKNYRHHLCHVASSYYSSGFKNALCLSIDGFGEHETGMFVSGVNGKLNILSKENVYPHSLGLLYSAITYFLGWKNHCDEGIIMGLASYGNSKNKIPGSNKSYLSVFREILEDKKNLKYHINSNFIDYYTTRNKWVTEKFVKIFGKKRDYKNKITQHHKDIAAALQDRLEEIVLSHLRYAKKKYKFDKLCLAGGVALNCSLNGKIAKSKIFDEIFVFPASGDDGCAVGACFLSYKDKVKKFSPKRNMNFYIGSSFSDKKIEQEAKKLKLKFKRSKNIYSEVAGYLKEGKIVAWFQGGAEFGPRALGNRSILCKPFPIKMRDHLNKRVKFREEFRPFAPSVLDKYQKDFFELDQDSPHMLIATKVKKNKKNLIPAVVHIDDTCRVQTVKKNINERFYDLIESFNKLTKIPVLLNTSFNVKGQPIVNTPSEALETFKSTNIDVLAIGDFVLIK